MSDLSDDLSSLEAALAVADTSLIVLAAGTVAEIRGPLMLRRGPEWLTLGHDGGSHLHVKTADIRGMRFREPADSSAALEVLGHEGALLCKVCFSGTNPARPKTYDGDRAEQLRARFQHLREREEA